MPDHIFRGDDNWGYDKRWRGEGRRQGRGGGGQRRGGRRQRGRHRWKRCNAAAVESAKRGQVRKQSISEEKTITIKLNISLQISNFSHIIDIRISRQNTKKINDLLGRGGTTIFAFSSTFFSLLES